MIIIREAERAFLNQKKKNPKKVFINQQRIVFSNKKTRSQKSLYKKTKRRSQKIFTCQKEIVFLNQKQKEPKNSL